LFCNSLRATWW